MDRYRVSISYDVWQPFEVDVIDNIVFSTHPSEIANNRFVGMDLELLFLLMGGQGKQVGAVEAFPIKIEKINGK